MNQDTNTKQDQTKKHSIKYQGTPADGFTFKAFEDEVKAQNLILDSILYHPEDTKQPMYVIFDRSVDKDKVFKNLSCFFFNKDLVSWGVNKDWWKYYNSTLHDAGYTIKQYIQGKQATGGEEQAQTFPEFASSSFNTPHTRQLPLKETSTSQRKLRQQSSQVEQLNNKLDSMSKGFEEWKSASESDTKKRFQEQEQKTENFFNKMMEEQQIRDKKHQEEISKLTEEVNFQKEARKMEMDTLRNELNERQGRLLEECGKITQQWIQDLADQMRQEVILIKQDLAILIGEMETTNTNLALLGQNFEQEAELQVKYFGNKIQSLWKEVNGLTAICKELNDRIQKFGDNLAKSLDNVEPQIEQIVRGSFEEIFGKKSQRSGSRKEEEEKEGERPTLKMPQSHHSVSIQTSGGKSAFSQVKKEPQASGLGMEVEREEPVEK